jgi:hypothetical protein
MLGLNGPPVQTRWRVFQNGTGTVRTGVSTDELPGSSESGGLSFLLWGEPGPGRFEGEVLQGEVCRVGAGASAGVGAEASAGLGAEASAGLGAGASAGLGVRTIASGCVRGGMFSQDDCVGVRSWGWGMRTDCMPARVAASMPMLVSSKTRQVSGGTLSFLAARR